MLCIYSLHVNALYQKIAKAFWFFLLLKFIQMGVKNMYSPSRQCFCLQYWISDDIFVFLTQLAKKYNDSGRIANRRKKKQISPSLSISNIQAVVCKFLAHAFFHRTRDESMNMWKCFDNNLIDSVCVNHTNQLKEVCVCVLENSKKVTLHIDFLKGSISF